MPGHSCQRTCPLWWAPLVLERGGGQVWVGPAAGRVRRRREGGAPGGLSGERLAYDGVRGGRPGAVVVLVLVRNVGHTCQANTENDLAKQLNSETVKK